MPYGILLKDKRRTWNILIFKMIRLLRHHFSHSTFDVGRSMLDVLFFSKPSTVHPAQK